MEYHLSTGCHKDECLNLALGWLFLSGQVRKWVEHVVTICPQKLINKFIYHVFSINQ